MAKNIIQKGSGHLNRNAVEKLRQTRRAIRQAYPDAVFDDSLELLYQAREERTKELERQ